MSKLTLDEAIQHCLEVAEQNEFETRIFDELNRPGDEEYRNNHCQCAAEHRQLAEWLTELKEAKRLLKAAVEDANVEAESLCAFCKHNDLVDGCPYIQNYSECEYVWRYTDEALKLIGEEGGNNAQNTFQRQEPQR